MYQTNQYEGMIAETITMQGHKGDTINAYIARPLGTGPFPGMVAIHHAPGWDEWYRECTRRFAHHGYVTISPNLYFRDGHGTAEDVGAKVRAGRRHARRSSARRSGRRQQAPALAALRQRQSRRIRHLLRRPPWLSRRLPAQGLRRAGGMLGRQRRAETGRTDAQAPRRADRLYQGSFLPDDRDLRQRRQIARRRIRSTCTKRN